MTNLRVAAYWVLCLLIIIALLVAGAIAAPFWLVRGRGQ